MRLAAKGAGDGKSLALSRRKASDIKLEGIAEAQFSKQLRRIEIWGKVVANAIGPPSGFGRYERNALAPLAGRHASARLRSELDIPGSGIEIDDRPKQE